MRKGSRYRTVTLADFCIGESGMEKGSRYLHRDPSVFFGQFVNVAQAMSAALKHRGFTG